MLYLLNCLLEYNLSFLISVFKDFGHGELICNGELFSAHILAQTVELKVAGKFACHPTRSSGGS
jgi:hypothetical protein